MYRLLLLLSCVAASANATLPDEWGAPLGNARGLAVWFKGLGQELVESLATAEGDWKKTIDVSKLRKALRSEVIVLDQNDSLDFKNLYGEVKDGKVVFYGPDYARIYLNRYVWTHFFESNQPEFRTVLHFYLYAAGYDDRHYAYSALVPADALPVASPDDEPPPDSLLWKPEFRDRPDTRKMANGDWVIVRKENPAAGFIGGHYRHHPSYLEADSIERYDANGILRWIYFPRDFPVRPDYALNFDYLSFRVTAIAKAPGDAIVAAGTISVSIGYRYAFALKLDAEGRLEQLWPLAGTEAKFYESQLAIGTPRAVLASPDGIEVETESWQVRIGGSVTYERKKR